MSRKIRDPGLPAQQQLVEGRSLRFLLYQVGIKATPAPKMNISNLHYFTVLLWRLPEIIQVSPLLKGETAVQFL